MFLYCLAFSTLTIIEVCRVLLLHISVISHVFAPYRFIFVLLWQLQYCVSLKHKWGKEDGLIDRHIANDRSMLLALYLYDCPTNCLLSFFLLFCIRFILILFEIVLLFHFGCYMTKIYQNCQNLICQRCQSWLVLRKIKLHFCLFVILLFHLLQWVYTRN